MEASQGREAPLRLRASPEGGTRDAAALARRYVGARGPVISAAEYVGRRAQALRGLAPGAEASAALEDLAGRALDFAYRTAARSHGGAEAPGWLSRVSGPRFHRLATTAAGAIGGSAGLGSALAELPLTTTAMLRSIQEVAAAHGEDLRDPETRLECLAVFGQGGPLPSDDEIEAGFFAARLGLTRFAAGPVLRRVAPRFGLVVGEKLAAQATPAFGAVAGAVFNHAFTAYYQEMAEVRFGLRGLERLHGAGIRVEFAEAVRATRARPVGPQPS